MPELDFSFVETSKLFLQEVDRSCRRAHTQSTLSMQSVGTTSGTSSSPVPPGGSQSITIEALKEFLSKYPLFYLVDFPYGNFIWTMEL